MVTFLLRPKPRRNRKHRQDGNCFAIYLRMSKQKDITHKQIVVVEAKLSAAGASTYYQLIKAKLG